VTKITAAAWHQLSLSRLKVHIAQRGGGWQPDLLAVRALITNSHQAEGVGSMAGKIVFRPKSNMPLLVFLLMVIAQTGNSGLSSFFVEETERQNAPRRRPD